MKVIKQGTMIASSKLMAIPYLSRMTLNIWFAAVW